MSQARTEGWTPELAVRLVDALENAARIIRSDMRREARERRLEEFKKRSGRRKARR